MWARGQERASGDPASEPEVLRSYRDDHPRNTWDQFRQLKDGRKQVFAVLAEAQGGLCAWCEDTILPPPDHLLGVQVEHVLAKSRTTHHGPNLHLDFTNMVASCAGGTNRFDPERHLDPIKRTQSRVINIMGARTRNDL